MLNILMIAYDTSTQVHRMYHYLEERLTDYANVMIWRKPGHIDLILRSLPTRPEFILLLNDIGRQMEPMIRGLAHTGIPTGLFVNDVHRFVNLRRNFIRKHRINHLFTVTRDKFKKLYPDYIKKMEWFPHFVETDIFRDYQLKKDINLLMMGAVNDVYPLRQEIIKAYEGDPHFVYHQHPGYRAFNKNEEWKYFIGNKYVREINRAKIVFTCPSVFYYPVIKYFEVLACKSLLLAPTFPELEDLGFTPGFHFVPINDANFKEQASYYLKNETERLQIAEQGYQFVHQQHSATIRTEQLVEKVKSILQL